MTSASVVQLRRGRRVLGAGVIWPLPDRVVTAAHVVAEAGRVVEIATLDGPVRRARVLAADRRRDLALLILPSGGGPVARLGDSDALRVGELVFAVGHPWGRSWTVSGGIVSGLGPVRLPGAPRPVSCIRSDVRLAPGNSGGPLVNAAGEVVGIATMVVGGDLGVALPSRTVRDWVEALADPRIAASLSVA